MADMRAQLRGGKMKIDLRTVLLAPAAGAGNPNQSNAFPLYQQTFEFCVKTQWSVPLPLL